MPYSEEKEERIWFSKEDRIKIHHDNYGVCARCGKKLTPASMTIEHIIPLSRGGKNEMENLCCLCEEHNKEKGNKFYLPIGWYHAIENMPRFQQISEYVAKWYRSLPEENKTNLIRYPMITPEATLSIVLGGAVSFKGHRKKAKVAPIPQLELNWKLIGNDLYAEVAAVTGQSVRECRRYTCNEVAGLKEEEPEAGAYILKKVSSDKLLMMAIVRYIEEEHTFVVHIPWVDMSKTFMGPSTMSLIEVLLYSLVTVTGLRIDGYVIDSPYENIFDSFIHTRSMNPKIGRQYRFGTVEKQDGSFISYRLEVDRKEYKMPTIKLENGGTEN